MSDSSDSAPTPESSPSPSVRPLGRNDFPRVQGSRFWSQPADLPGLFPAHDGSFGVNTLIGLDASSKKGKKVQTGFVDEEKEDRRFERRLRRKSGKKRDMNTNLVAAVNNSRKEAADESSDAEESLVDEEMPYFGPLDPSIDGEGDLEPEPMAGHVSSYNGNPFTDEPRDGPSKPVYERAGPLPSSTPFSLTSGRHSSASPADGTPFYGIPKGLGSQYPTAPRVPEVRPDTSRSWNEESGLYTNAVLQTPASFAAINPVNPAPGNYTGVTAPVVPPFEKSKKGPQKPPAPSPNQVLQSSTQQSQQLNPMTKEQPKKSPREKRAPPTEKSALSKGNPESEKEQSNSSKSPSGPTPATNPKPTSPKMPPGRQTSLSWRNLSDKVWHIGRTALLLLLAGLAMYCFLTFFFDKFSPDAVGSVKFDRHDWGSTISEFRSKITNLIPDWSSNRLPSTPPTPLSKAQIDDITKRIQADLPPQAFAQHKGLEKQIKDLVKQLARLQEASSVAMTRTQTQALVDKTVAKATKDGKLNASIADQIKGGLVDGLQNRINFFSKGHGAIVDPNLSSVVWDPSKLKIKSKKWLVNTYLPQPRAIALLPGMEEGECFCAAPDTKNRGRGAGLHILTSRNIVPRVFEVNHRAERETLDPGAAPRNIELWANFDEATLRDEVRLFAEARFPHTPTETFLHEGFVQIAQEVYHPAQFGDGLRSFTLDDELRRIGAAASGFFVRAADNHGADHTCFYQLKMYGDVVEREDDSKYNAWLRN